MTNSPTEEELMAFVDGELEPAAAAALGRSIERTPELQQRVAIYSETRNSLEKLYASRVDEPVPQHLIDLISSYKPSPRRNVLGTIGTRAKGFLDGLLGGADDFSYPRLATLAASILVAGIFIGQSITIFPDDGEKLQVVQIGPLSNNSQLKIALSTTVSGETIKWQASQSGSHQQFKPLLTFRSKEAEYCRQFTLTASTSSRISAIACLEQTTGHWHIVSAAEQPNTGNDANNYQTASSAQSPETTATLARLMDDIPLEENKERELIQSKWNAD